MVREEIARREDRLARRAEAKAVIEARAQERVAAEQADYEAKLAERAERERMTGRRPRGRPPMPPVPGPRDGDQYNFTDPESRIMKNPTNAGFEQDYNVQVAVDQASLLIVASALSNHPNDSQEAEPTLEAIPSALGTPEAAALDAGYFGPATRASCAKRGIEPYIATGRDPHHPRGPQRFAPLSEPPPEDASSKAQDGLQAQNRAGQSDLWRTQMYGRTGDRHPQGGPWFPPVLLAWALGGGGGVVSGLFGVQSQALPYLILGVVQGRGHLFSSLRLPRRPSSACNCVLFWRSCRRCEGHAHRRSSRQDCSTVLSDRLLEVPEAEASCTHGEVPDDALWGVHERRTTSGVQREISYLCGRLTFEEAAESLCRHMPLGMSARQALSADRVRWERRWSAQKIGR